MGKLSKERKEQLAEWDKNHLKRMSLAIPIELYERMSEHITETSESANGFIRRAIEEKLDRSK